MPRAKYIGYITVLVAIVLTGLFGYAVYYLPDLKALSTMNPVDMTTLSSETFYGLTVPIAIIVAMILGTGFWIGWTILTIKVVPPIAEIVEKKDFSKIKAFFLCTFTLALGAAFVYGIYLKSFWALAVPASVIAAVILGAIFWVGFAIITTRATLNK